MNKQKAEKIDALIFIDTNILLDFYRIRKSDVSLKYLEKIVKHKDIIITSSQVEMEFKKNRQAAILEAITEVKNIQQPKINAPTILSDAKAVEMIEKSSKDIKKQQDRLKKRIEGILKYPNRNDQVFISLQKVFKAKTPINLNRENKERFKIRTLAKKRFILGYPPRKKNDTSIGDGVNWEWIIQCADNTGKHIIIVTRDSDFGSFYGGEAYLNDWLCQEFKQRINQKRKLILTDKLSVAFKHVQIPVTDEMVKEEESILTTMELLKRIQGRSATYNPWQNQLDFGKSFVSIKDILENYNTSLKNIGSNWDFLFDDENKGDD